MLEEGEVEFVKKMHSGKLSIVGMRVDGVYKKTAKWAEHFGITVHLIRNRIRRGERVAAKLFAPAMDRSEYTTRGGEATRQKELERRIPKGANVRYVNGYRIFEK